MNGEYVRNLLHEPIPTNSRTPMPKKIIILLALISGFAVSAQKKTIAQIKLEIEKSTNPPLYVKDVLKKKFRIDTVAILSTTSFNNLFDSLAYKGTPGKVY